MNYSQIGFKIDRITIEAQVENGRYGMNDLLPGETACLWNI